MAANISGLTARTTYHFQIAATNSSGTTYGSDSTFATLSATGPDPVYAGCLERSAAEGSTHREMGGNHGKGAYSAGCIADTLAARHVLRRIRS